MLSNVLGVFMRYCYLLVKNYGLAIILFTVISKIVLLPISVWVHKNSIKMVKMMPTINNIKIRYFGDKDRIAEEESKLYKKEKYNPLISIIPLLLQIIILIGLINVINHPITYILKMPKDINNDFINILLDSDKSLNQESTSLEVYLVNDIKKEYNYSKYLDLKGKYNENDLLYYIENIKTINFAFLGFDLGKVANVDKGISLLAPIFAGLSALIFCLTQNKMNVLQRQQSKFGKYSTMAFSIGLSLYLGFFVVVGVALYWIASNLISILQQYLLNKIIDPNNFVNHELLEETTKELKKLEELSKNNNKLTIEEKRKEKEDYRRFFRIVNKHLVFYSESNGFYKYYKGIIDYLLENSKITIHYITSDYNDNIFKMEKEMPNRIKAYFISEKRLITLMMKMDADVVVMTMPDIDNYHIKRSYVRKDIEYIFVPHSIASLNLTMRYKSMDNYDTIFAVGKDQKKEILKENSIYNLNRKVVEYGYSLLDDMIKNYKKEKNKNKIKTILIAPSWQKDNIVDLCLDGLLDRLKECNYKIIVRPHPQHVRHMKEKFDGLKTKYKDNKMIEIQTDFTSNKIVFNADLLITDWSSIGFEYAFTTEKPVLYINTPMKIMNEHYKEVNSKPFISWVRNEIGEIVDPHKLKDIDKVVSEMLNNSAKYSETIKKIKKEYIYNLGKSGEVGGNYIIESIKNKINEKKKESE